MQGDINRLLLVPDTNGCVSPKGKDAKLACTQVQTLRDELVLARKADAARSTLQEKDAKVLEFTGRLRVLPIRKLKQSLDFLA